LRWCSCWWHVPHAARQQLLGLSSKAALPKPRDKATIQEYPEVVRRTSLPSVSLWHQASLHCRSPLYFQTAVAPEVQAQENTYTLCRYKTTGAGMHTCVTARSLLFCRCAADRSQRRQVSCATGIQQDHKGRIHRPDQWSSPRGGGGNFGVSMRLCRSV
jgi:hypothetical protein